ncbi:Polypeptide N-acetylgalactosaminyltransferase 9 [Bienertia sinuspersici]
MDSLEAAMGKFKLTDEEDVLDMDEIPSDDMQVQIELCLVGKLFTNSAFNAEAMKTVLRAAWKPQKNMLIRELGKNLFIFQFFSGSDRRHVLEGGPWAFDGHLLLIRSLEGDEQPENIEFTYADFWVRIYNVPMEKRNKEGATWLGRSIGAFLEMDESDLSGWTKSLRIWVRLNITKPLCRASPMKGRARQISKEREEENKLIQELRESSKAKRRLSYEVSSSQYKKSGGLKGGKIGVRWEGVGVEDGVGIGGKGKEVGCTGGSFKGYDFTWWNGRQGGEDVKERLDRFLVDSKCLTNDGGEGNALKQLEEFKQKLEEWSAKHFGSVKEEIRKATEGLRMVRDGESRKKWMKKIRDWRHKEEVMWWQRSIMEFMKYGDQNSRWFHEKASQRRRNNHINGVRNEDGDWMEDENDGHVILGECWSMWNI